MPVEKPEPIFVFGAGGHGRSVCETLRRQDRFRLAAVLDDRPEPGKALGGLGPQGGRGQLGVLAERGIRRGVVAIGDNRDRELIVELAGAAGLDFVSVIDPTAVIAEGVEIGRGTVVMPSAVVNVGSRVGAHAILNTACSVDHDCVIGDFSHLSPGVNVSGECHIGDRAHIGIGASVIQEVTVGAKATVGAGAAVVEDIPAGVIAVGVPARPLGPSL